MSTGHTTDRGWWHPGQQDGCPKCEIAPQEARAIADVYVAEHLPGRRVRGLLEDADDYLVQLAYLPGPPLLGGSVIFISKRTGLLRHEPTVLAVQKAAAMAPVEPPDRRMRDVP